MKSKSNSKIRIFYGGFTSTGGGAYTHAKILSNSLIKLGFDVELITLDNLPLILRYLPHLLLHLFNLFLPGIGFIVKGKAIGFLYRTIWQQTVDLTIYEDLYISNPSQVDAITVIHALWTDNLQSYSFPSASINRLLSIEADKINSISHPIITVSNPYKDYLENLHFPFQLPNKIKVVELGIDIDDILSYRHSNKHYNPYSLCFCGSLEERKNLFFLIDIFRILYKHDSNYRLTLIGDGPLKTRLFQKIKHYSLPINLTGKLSRSQMLRAVSLHSLMVHTSTKESFSFALLEAKLLGLNTFASDSLEVPNEFIDVPISNYSTYEWSESIIKFNPSQITSRDLSYYSSTRMANQMINLI